MSHKCLAAFCCVSLKDNKILGQIMSRSVYRYYVSLCYLCISLTVSVVSVKRQEVTETVKSVTETSRTYRNFTMAVLYHTNAKYVILSKLAPYCHKKCHLKFFMNRCHAIFITRNVTVCNKCPRRSLIMTLIPGCDLEHRQGNLTLGVGT